MNKILIVDNNEFKTNDIISYIKNKNNYIKTVTNLIESFKILECENFNYIRFKFP